MLPLAIAVTMALVNTALEKLIAQTVSGNGEKLQELVRALRAEAVQASTLVELARAEQPVIRCAAILASAGRSEPQKELREVLAELAQDPSKAVRKCLAEQLANMPAMHLETHALARLLRDDEWEVRHAAVRSARGNPAVEAALLNRLEDEDWHVRQAAAESLAHGSPRIVLPTLLTALAKDGDSDVCKASAVSLEKHLTQIGGYPDDLQRPPRSELQEALKRVKSHGGVPRLTAWLEERIAVEVDFDELRGFGSILTSEAEAGRLPHAFRVAELCDSIRAVLLGPPPRAVVLLGEAGSGKTAVVHELTHQLRNDRDGSWQVLRVAPADMLAGTTWLGEWQTKVRNLVQAVKAPRRVVLYVPNLEELANAGRTSQSDSNVATALAPYIERGEVAIVGESTPEAFRAGLGAIGSLRRLFHAIEVQEAKPAQTRDILKAVRDEAAVDVPEAVLDRLIELADFYLAGTAQPGRTVGLLRRVIGSAAERDRPVSERDVLTTLSTSTGIPIDFLDDAVPLDRARVRGFFEERVMGQADAVDAVVDLVTLVKAGLTDPAKPFGVLFFVGPTGVGKTELARAVAELLFGDAARLFRLDMSEFATYDAYERLIGWGAHSGLLTAAVRERPFTVVLLDEIEKAHPNVFDLCLQIFDAGRLTDKQGRTADFRRSIIILTSNIGSAVPREAPVGFRASSSGASPGVATPGFSPEATLRELSRWFRPEFLNRLDRIVTFQPLGAEIAEKIARREVARVLERSGLARRRLAVDVEPGVFSLLLREGYSPAFGARPLKRTVERLVLLPVARSIAAGDVPFGSVLRLRVRGNHVAAEVTPPVVEEDKETRRQGDKETQSVNARARPPAPEQRRSLAERVAGLAERIAGLRSQAEPLESRKSQLVTHSTAANFWDDPAAAREVQDEIYRLDGVFATLAALERALRNEAEAVRPRRNYPLDVPQMEERLEALESRVRHAAFLVTCRNVRELGDAFVSLTLIASRGDGLEAIDKLARMYADLAQRRGLEFQVLDDRQGGTPPEDTLTLLVNGAGAFALLAGEAGLHQVSRGRAHGRDGRGKSPDRDVVRVDVLPVPIRETGFGQDEVRVEVRPLGDVRGRLLARPRFEAQLLHMASMTSVRAWTDGPKGQVVERLRPLLAARVEAARTAPAAPGQTQAIVRHYVLGPAPLVRDLRTRRRTGRLDRVLKGHLDAFLFGAESPSPE